MNDLTVYHLTPPAGHDALSFHFGRQGIGLEEATEALSSDSFFAALVTQAAVLDGITSDEKRIPAFARRFLDGAPPLLHSSIFPRLGDMPLLPRPSLPLAMLDDKLSERIGKGFKRLRYLSPALFVAVCTNQAITEPPLIMQDGKVWMTIAEAETLPEPWKRKPNESDVAWRARLQETRIWSIASIPRVTVDRVTSASAYYEVGRVTYAGGAGLALLARFNDPATQPYFELLLTLLGESGLGGRRSSGYGAFVFAKGPAITHSLGTAGQRAILLSRYVPRTEEVAALLGKSAAYQLVNVGGWLYSVGHPAQRRQRVRMVTEGSVLDLSAGSVRGEIVNVQPNYAKSTRKHPVFGAGFGTSHPVYRSGLALTVPIPDKEAS